MAGTVQKRTVDDDFAAHHKGVVLRDDGQQGVVIECGVHHHFMACLAQELVENRVGVVGDEYPHGVLLLGCGVWLGEV